MVTKTAIDGRKIYFLIGEKGQIMDDNYYNNSKSTIYEFPITKTNKVWNSIWSKEEIIHFI